MSTTKGARRSKGGGREKGGAFFLDGGKGIHVQKTPGQYQA